MEARQDGRIGVRCANDYGDMLDPGICWTERNDPSGFGIGERDMSPGDRCERSGGLHLKASDRVGVRDEQVVLRSPCCRFFTVWDGREDHGGEQAGPFAQHQCAGSSARCAGGRAEWAAHGVIEIARWIRKAADGRGINVGRQGNHNGVLASGRDIEDRCPKTRDRQPVRDDPKVGQGPKAVFSEFCGENHNAVLVLLDDNGGSPPQFGNGPDNAPRGSRGRRWILAQG